MSIVLSILEWLAIVLGILVVLIGLASLWPVRVRVEADERGGSGSVSWLGWSYRQDRRTRTWELRLSSWSVVRRPFRGKRAEAADGERTQDEEKSSKTPSGLSPGGLLRIARAALREARRLLRHIHVEELRTSLVVATPDPALTGELFGYGAALAATARTLWPGARLDLGLDFIADAPRGDIDAAIRTRPIWWGAGAVRVGWVFLRERRRSRRRRSAGRR